MKIIGLMSGTSMDGLDIALCEIKREESKKIRLINFQNLSYPKNLKERLDEILIHKKSETEEIAKLNIDLGFFYGNSVNNFISGNNLKKHEIKLIGSHGQTIFHKSKKKTGNVTLTLQVGDGAIISKVTGIPVVSDFRMDDIAVFGEGAPLTPYFHYYFFKDLEKPVSIVNIGGISNITFIPYKNRREENVIAFDTGPGNSLIDLAMGKFLPELNINFDENGEIASKGKINRTLLHDLLSDEYFTIPPPKSTGREQFGYNIIKKIYDDYKMMKSKDILSTLTEFTAISIHDSYKNFIEPVEKIEELFITGGGAYNNYLVNRIKNKFQNITVKTLEEIGLNSDAMEAMAFAFFAYQTFIKRSPITIPSVTGAKKAVVSGKISLP